MTLAAISGPMTIDAIAQIRAGVLQAFDPGKKVRLSLAGVTAADFTALQLLCSAHRTSMARGMAFEVTGADLGPLAAVSQLAGMLRHTGCAHDTSGSCLWKREAP